MNDKANKYRCRDGILDIGELLAEQIAYYDAHASEYDDALSRRGRWDYGYEENSRWFKEFYDVRHCVEKILYARSVGHVLDVASGTGYWAKVMALSGYDVHAIDTSPRMLKRAKEICEGLSVTFGLEDAFLYKPKQKFDIVFLGCWLSHVHRLLIAKFMAEVVSWLAEGGLIIVVDHLPFAGTFAKGTSLTEASTEVVKRVTLDGQIFHIPKVFWSEENLREIFEDVKFTSKKVFLGKSFFVFIAARKCYDLTPYIQPSEG